MNILALCSALNNTYLGFEIEQNNEIKKIHEIIKSDENYHSLYLIAKIKQIIDENNFSLNDLDLICVNTGPGSFTGIRVALSVAKIIAGELDIPLVPLNTAEILLREFDSDYLIMDARRDMYFLGTKEKIELIKKEDLKNSDEFKKIMSEKKILTDKNSFNDFKEIIEINPDSKLVCFENIDKKISISMIEIAKNRYLNSNNKEEFKYLNVKANYIQTPPVF